MTPRAVDIPSAVRVEQVDAFCAHDDRVVPIPITMYGVGVWLCHLASPAESVRMLADHRRDPSLRPVSTICENAWIY
jgi:hypothetical protein